MFLRVQRKIYGGEERLYAAVVENERVNGKIVQHTVLNIGRVEADQVPFLRAAWSRKKPRLVWDDD